MRPRIPRPSTVLILSLIIGLCLIVGAVNAAGAAR
jgi:hypothetical protein